MRLYVKDCAGLTRYFRPSVGSEGALEVVKPGYRESTRLRIRHFDHTVAEGRNKDYAHLAACAAKPDGFTFVDLRNIHHHCICFWVVIKDDLLIYISQGRFPAIR